MVARGLHHRLEGRGEHLLDEVILTPKSWLVRGQMKIWPMRRLLCTRYTNTLLFEKIQAIKRRFFFWRFFQKVCHADLNSSEQQGILPDQFDHVRSIAIGYPNSRCGLISDFRPLFCQPSPKESFFIRYSI